LPCQGIDPFLNNLPIIGVQRNSRNPLENSEFSIKSLNIFNENGFPDKLEDSFGKIVNDNTASAARFGQVKRWDNVSIAQYIFKSVIQAQGGKFYGQMAKILDKNIAKDILRAKNQGTKNPGRTEDNFSLAQGLSIFVKQATYSSNTITHWDFKKSSVDNPKFFLNLVGEIEDSGQFLWIDDADQATPDKSKVPPGITVTYDFLSPQKMLMTSGKALISTTLALDPNADYAETTKNDDPTESPQMSFVYEPSINQDAPVFNSKFGGVGAPGTNPNFDYNQGKLFRSNKAETISQITPRIDTVSEDGVIKYAEPSEIFIKLKKEYEITPENPFQTLLGELGIMKVGSSLWKRAKEIKVGPPDAQINLELVLTGIEKLKFKVNGDRLGLTITGFNPRKDSDGVLKDDTYKILTKYVDLIYIPVTIKIDERVLVQAEQKKITAGVVRTQGGWITAKSLERKDVKIDPTKGMYLYEARENLSKIEYLGHMEKTKTDNVWAFEEAIKFDPSDIMIQASKGILFNSLLGDGNNVTITIPKELYMQQRVDVFPGTDLRHILGLEVQNIVGSPKLAKHELIRPMLCDQIDYDNSNITLLFN